jgi:hypothetical protein
MNLSALRSRRVFVVLAALCVVALATTAAFAWGFTGHEMITHQAVALLSGNLGAFLTANADSLQAFSDEPDVISEGNRDEQINHFLDMDAFGVPPFSAIPDDESEFVRRFGKDALKEGRLPWAAAGEYKALVQAFKAGDKEAILRHGGHLSHYVADSTMPLHATKNYKGQATGNVIFAEGGSDRHVHLRFEVGMVEANRDAIAALMAKRAGGVHQVGNPATEVLNNLRNGYSLIDRLLAADREVLPEGAPMTPAYYKNMYAKVGDIAADQMAFAAGEVASFWRSAYVEAGSPMLPTDHVTLATPPLSKEIVLNKEKPRVETTK